MMVRGVDTRSNVWYVGIKLEGDWRLSSSAHGGLSSHLLVAPVCIRCLTRPPLTQRHSPHSSSLFPCILTLSATVMHSSISQLINPIK